MQKFTSKNALFKDRNISIEFMIKSPIDLKGDVSSELNAFPDFSSVEPKFTKSKKAILPVRIQPKRRTTNTDIKPEEPKSPEPKKEEEPVEIILSNTQDQLVKNKNFTRQIRAQPRRRASQKKLLPEASAGPVIE